MREIKGVFFDAVGTTVLEKDPEFINHAFMKAFEVHGIFPDKAEVVAVRGMNKLEAIKIILNARKSSEKLEPAIFSAFTASVFHNLSNFSEHPSFPTLVETLQRKRIRIGIGSGLPQRIFDILFKSLGWKKYALDYVNVYENFERGRPHPDMIIDFGVRLGIPAHAILKVGDTVSDVEEGRRAGAMTAAVLSGTQPFAKLKASNPDFLLPSVGDIAGVIAPGII